MNEKDNHLLTVELSEEQNGNRRRLFMAAVFYEGRAFFWQQLLCYNATPTKEKV